MVTHMPAIFNGPVELVKDIFDTAAKQERSTALKLIRVCKTARQWIIPILYETVELDNPSALRFEKMLALPSSSLLVSLVRHMRATCLPDVDLLSSHNLKVQTLTVANYDVQRLDRLVLPSLTHLTIGGLLRHSHFSTNMPALTNVTHLRFPNDVPLFPTDLAPAMPNLTHFSCCYYPSKMSQHRQLERCLNIILTAPALRVVVVYVHANAQKAEDLAADMPVIRDPRVVLMSSIKLQDGRHNLSPTYGSLWTLAENKLKA